MYIRTSQQKSPSTGKTYITYRLVDTYRNPQGKVRQQLILNLGAYFAVPKEHWKLLADRINELLTGQESLLALEPMLEKQAQTYAKRARPKYGELQQARLDYVPIPQSDSDSDYHSVDVNSIEHTELRHVGIEALSVHATDKLKLQELLQSIGFNSKQCELALASIIGRLICPGSELHTHYYLTNQSALDELLGTDFSSLSIKNFYSIADKLLKHKDQIENELFQREKTLFSLKQTVTLYDITNTYFEGRALQNLKAKHGRSKQKRSDCPLVSLGLVLDGSGFAKRSEIYAGNISEPKTLEDMLGKLNVEKRATIIMDAGFATEENLTWLKNNDYYYIVVSRKAKPVLEDDINRVLVKDTVNNKVTASIIHTAKDEVTLYCHSEAKEAKAQMMRNKSRRRFEEELEKLANGLEKKTGVKKTDKINERIGRIKERHKKIAAQYKIDIRSENNKVSAITWFEKKQDEDLGVYCLRSNRTDLTEKELWELYTTLTDVEAAFRSLKTELGLRPIYHQKEKRVDAHIFISVIAYHLMHTIRYQLKQHNITFGWKTIRNLFRTQMRITTMMKSKDGKQLSVRKSSKATPEQQVIYKALGVKSEPGEIEKAIC